MTDFRNYFELVDTKPRRVQVCRPGLESPPYAPPKDQYFQLNSIWLFLFISQLGTWMHIMASRWLILELTDDAMYTSLVTAAAILPTVLFGFYAGDFADRFGSKKALILSLIIMSFCSIILGTLILIQHIGPISLLLLTFLLGIGNALYLPSWQVIMGGLSKAHEIDKNVILQSLSFNSACILGPIIGSQILARGSYSTIFFIDALSFTVFAIACINLRSSIPSSPMSIAISRKENLTKILADHKFMTVLTGMFLLLIPANILWSLLPVLVKYNIPDSPYIYSHALACLGFGAILRGILSLLPKFKRFMYLFERPAPLFLAGALALLPYLRTELALNACLVISGFAWTIITTSFNSAALKIAPAENKASAMSVYSITFNSALAIGAILWGASVSEIGISISFSITAIWIIIVFSLRTIKQS